MATTTGFAGGWVANPTYQEVCTKETGHAETVAVVYDLRLLSTRELLREFFVLHDSTLDRRADGGQYRSAIFLPATGRHADKQEIAAHEVLRLLRDKGLNPVTEISRIDAFYAADARHQQYCSSKGIVPKKREIAEIRKILTF